MNKEHSLRLLEGKRVLVIEENPDYAESLSHQCRQIWGARSVDYVYDAESALAKLTTKPFYDLVFLEIVLAPNIEVAERVRRLQAARDGMMDRTADALRAKPEVAGNEAVQLEASMRYGLLSDQIYKLLDLDGGIKLLDKYLCELVQRFGGDSEHVSPVMILTTQAPLLPKLYQDAAWCRIECKPVHFSELSDALIELMGGWSSPSIGID